MDDTKLIQKIAEDFIVAGAGAFAGAYAAQWIAERSKVREELLKEIRNTNAAVSIAFGICNSLLSMKQQHVKALKENHDAQKASFFAHAEQMRARETAGQEPIEFRYLADFQTLLLPYQPIDVLQEQLFRHLSVKGRALNIAVTLGQTIQSLKTSLEMRNTLIESYKKRNLSQHQIAILYFGAPYDGGHVNMEYPASIDAIYSQTNDGIYFSQLLCKDLVKYGKPLSDQFKKKFKKTVTIDEPDFTPAISAGLMPADTDYTSWVTSFIERPLPLTRMQTLIKWLRFWN